MEIPSRASVQNTMLMRSMLLHNINRPKDINMRKDIRTTEAEERKRQEAERTYKDFTSPHEFIPYRLSWAATL